MSTSKSGAAARPAPPQLPDMAAAAGELQRNQMRMAAEAACALFRGFESMRKVQEHAAHAALARHSAAAQRLTRPCAPAELLAIQAELMRFDLEGATRYWQQLAGAAFEMQSQMAACSLHGTGAQGKPHAAA